MTAHTSPTSAPAHAKAVYARVWRWHFYAGLYVVPFMVMLAVTGLVMLSAGFIDDRLYADRLFVPAPGQATVPLAAPIEAVVQAVPDRAITQVTPSFDPARSTQVLTSVEGAVITVYVDHTSGQVLGEVEDARRPSIIAHRVHGTLMVGQLGDWLIEIAAGFGVILIVTGLFLWWPRTGGRTRAFVVNRRPRRVFVRDVHRLVGIAVAPVFLFYLVSGLAWTDVWGGRFTQAWSTFPRERSVPAPAITPERVTTTHGEVLNAAGRLHAPWGIELTPMPVSVVARQHGEHDEHADHGMATPSTVTADQAVALARAGGIGNRYSVTLPRGPEGVWTISASGMAGLISDPRQELTVHIDRSSGEIRGVIGWADYSAPAKAMALGVPLHQGSFGTWNLVVAALVCLTIGGLSITGALAWWWRRPANAWRLAAPPLPAGVAAPRAALVTAVVLGIAFPLVGLTLAAVALLDTLAVRRIPALKAILD